MMAVIDLRASGRQLMASNSGLSSVDAQLSWQRGGWAQYCKSTLLPIANRPIERTALCLPFSSPGLSNCFFLSAAIES